MNMIVHALSLNYYSDLEQRISFVLGYLELLDREGKSENIFIMFKFLTLGRWENNMGNLGNPLKCS